MLDFSLVVREAACSSTPDVRALPVPDGTGADNVLTEYLALHPVDLALHSSFKVLATTAKTVLARSAFGSNSISLSSSYHFKAAETNTKTTVARSPLGSGET